MTPSRYRQARVCNRIGTYACVILLVCAGPGIFLGGASAQSNALTVSRNLGELVNESQIIVEGWVTSVVLEPHPQLKNLMTLSVTLQVEDTVKGQTGKTYSFRQAAIDRAELQRKMGYRPGQHLLLILMKPSVYGLTSPAGMEQGRFQIATGRDGKLLAANGYANAGLFRGLESQLRAKGVRISPEVKSMIAQPGAGAVPLAQLKSLIRALAAQ